jgi:predicted adenine nucleotide alpha hydrolase (AANH) superfamily ATPase
LKNEQYDKNMQDLIDTLTVEGKRLRLLLHCCCAPCSTAVLQRLNECFDISVYYYNPNIDNLEEHNLRARELEHFVGESGLAKECIIIPYEPKVYFEAIHGLEKEPEGGLRCEICFALRLRHAAQYATLHQFDYFTTTLTISPMKNAPLLNQLGEQMAAEEGANFLCSDFKKRGGYLLSTQLSKEYGIYRQDYCGCVFSKTSRETGHR